MWGIPRGRKAPLWTLVSLLAPPVHRSFWEGCPGQGRHWRLFLPSSRGIGELAAGPLLDPPPPAPSSRPCPVGVQTLTSLLPGVWGESLLGHVSPVMLSVPAHGAHAGAFAPSSPGGRWPWGPARPLSPCPSRGGRLLHTLSRCAHSPCLWVPTRGGFRALLSTCAAHPDHPSRPPGPMLTLGCSALSLRRVHCVRSILGSSPPQAALVRAGVVGGACCPRVSSERTRCSSVFTGWQLRWNLCRGREGGRGILCTGKGSSGPDSVPPPWRHRSGALGRGPWS